MYRKPNYSQTRGTHEKWQAKHPRIGRSLGVLEGEANYIGLLLAMMVMSSCCVNVAIAAKQPAKPSSASKICKARPVKIENRGSAPFVLAYVEGIQRGLPTCVYQFWLAQGRARLAVLKISETCHSQVKEFNLNVVEAGKKDSSGFNKWRVRYQKENQLEIQKLINAFWAIAEPLATTPELRDQMNAVLQQIKLLYDCKLMAEAALKRGEGRCGEVAAISAYDLLKSAVSRNEAIRLQQITAFQRLGTSDGGNDHVWLVVNGTASSQNVQGQAEVGQYLDDLGGDVCDGWHILEDGSGYFGKSDKFAPTYSSAAGWQRVETLELSLNFNLTGIPDSVNRFVDASLQAIGLARYVPQQQVTATAAAPADAAAGTQAAAVDRPVVAAKAGPASGFFAPDARTCPMPRPPQAAGMPGAGETVSVEPPSDLPTPAAVGAAAIPAPNKIDPSENKEKPRPIGPACRPPR